MSEKKGKEMAVRYFRERVKGPEAALEDAVASEVGNLFFTGGHSGPFWTGGSLPIGAGRPDLVVVSFEPDVFGLVEIDHPSAQILAYLRAVRTAGAETIATRLRTPKESILRTLDELKRAKAVASRDTGCYHLSKLWRNILPGIVTVEVKVSDWRNAARQATRNRIFAHESFVALPRTTALRVCNEEAFVRPGLGILGVDESENVMVVRPASRHRPKVWVYYYQLALAVAKYSEGRPDAIHRAA